MSGNTGLARTELPRAELVKLDGREGSFQMVRRSIDVPQDLIYKIGGGRGGYLASAFDLFARELGISFDVVSAEPIYEKSQLRAARVRVRAEYYNASGKLVADEAECYIDIELLYQESRAKWEHKLYASTMEQAKSKANNPDFVVEHEYYDAKAKQTKNGYAERAKKAVVRDADGNPEIKYLLPDEAECELWENFMTLRKNAMQKAQTVARRTLVQRAIAVKSFDANNPNAGKKMAIYGFVQVAGMEADNVFAEELHEAAPANMNPAAESSQPLEPEEAVVQPVKAASSSSQEEPGETQEVVKCDTCGRTLTEKDLKYCPRKNTGRNDCYNCWTKSKEA